LIDMLSDTVTCRTRSQERRGIREIAVDPFFNYFAGYRQSAEARKAGRTHRVPLRLLLVRLLSPLSVLRDIFFLPCFLYAAYRQPERTFDVCLGVGPWGGLTGWALRRLGKASVFVYVDRDFEAGLVPDRLRRGYTEAIESFGIRRADVVVCASRLLAERRSKKAKVEMELIPNGVDFERFEVARRSDRRGHQLIYVGNVISWSGLEPAIRALPRIRQAVPQISLTIVGDGLPDYVNTIERLIRDCGVTEAVRLLGKRPVEELGEFLAGAKIGLANSAPVEFRKYACPLKVIEYMAAGLPVIATADTEAGDMITRMDCGVAIQYGEDSFADAVIALMKDSATYERLSQNGIAHARTMTWDALLRREALAILRSCTRRRITLGTGEA
jgi:glycosyltransferase involved in cell wall biosynthesis